MNADLLPGFSAETVVTERGSVACWSAGRGPAVLLLHGFPETSAMWRDVAPLLADELTVVAADLPGYGASSCPADTGDHSAMSKRELAATLVGAMHALGHDRFAVVGHDRGGRVAYRAALDRPDAVAAVAVLDVVPTAEVWSQADARLALSFWPFSLLSQPAPLPERVLSAVPDAVVADALGNWGSQAAVFPDAVRSAYVEALRDTAHAHAICEEYRAAASIDRVHDEIDRSAGNRIRPPLLCLWSASGAVGSWYSEHGGPLALWRRWAERVEGEPVDGGHFFPEERPAHTARLLRDFLVARAGVGGAGWMTPAEPPQSS